MQGVFHPPPLKSVNSDDFCLFLLTLSCCSQIGCLQFTNFIGISGLKNSEMREKKISEMVQCRLACKQIENRCNNCNQHYSRCNFYFEGECAPFQVCRTFQFHCSSVNSWPVFADQCCTDKSVFPVQTTLSTSMSGVE